MAAKYFLVLLERLDDSHPLGRVLGAGGAKGHLLARLGEDNVKGAPAVHGGVRLPDTREVNVHGA